jgi:endoglycosylceramidase
MDRRRFLALGAATTGLAGCLGGDSSTDEAPTNTSGTNTTTDSQSDTEPLASCAGAVPSGTDTTAIGDRQFITDSDGRVVVPHGVNVVYKREPYYPPEDVFDESDVEQIRGWGFNFVRLGAIWAGVEPDRGEFDQAYLDRIRELVALFGEHDISVLVDYHQNLYSHVLGGDGAPEWAVDTEGELTDYEYDTVGEWVLNYAKPAVSNALTNFFTNHEGIQDEYARAWRHTAKTLRDEPNVIGYSIMNEPTPGIEMTNFETEQLPRMFNNVIGEIRAVDTKTPVWVEPSAAAFNLGSPTSLAGIEDPADRTVFSFHNYAPGNKREPIQNAVDAVERLEMPGVQTEFSTGNSQAVSTMVNTLDAELMGWAYWPYDESEKGWTSPAEYPPDFIGLDEGGGRKHLDILVRPYPQAVAGAPTTIAFDRVARTFELAYEPTDADGDTVVFVPDRQFDDPDISVEGASVLCHEGEYIRVGDHTADSVTVDITERAVYHVESVNSGKVLGVSASEGTAVQQSRSGADSQRWAISSVGDNVYRIETLGTEQALAVGQPAEGNGAAVIAEAWTGTDRQRWQVELVGNDVYRLRNVASGKVADVAGQSTADGAPVHQWADTGGDNQRWRLRRPGSS